MSIIPGKIHHLDYKIVLQLLQRTGSLTVLTKTFCLPRSGSPIICGSTGQNKLLALSKSKSQLLSLKKREHCCFVKKTSKSQRNVYDLILDPFCLAGRIQDPGPHQTEIDPKKGSGSWIRPMIEWIRILDSSLERVDLNLSLKICQKI